MPDYRRFLTPGGTYFFTLVSFERRPIFADPRNVQRLRNILRGLRAKRPFLFVAAVVLPDHLHFIWTMPEADADYSSRIRQMKVAFTKEYRRVGWAPPTALTGIERAGGQCPPYISRSRARHRERDVWQRRFWEHRIRDATDFENHLNYIHYNPVKHGHARCPHAWAFSSFGQWVTKGQYEQRWCCSCDNRRVKIPYPVSFDDTVGE